MDGTTFMKWEMWSFVDIGMKDYNKGIGSTPFEMTSQLITFLII
jgi:hypothetical protein